MSTFSSSEFRPFASPLDGSGKEHFRKFCENNKINFDEWLPKLSSYFSKFPAMIHVQTVERHCYMSWWNWMHLCAKELV